MSDATAVAEEAPITEAPPEAVNDAPPSDAGLPTSTDAAVPAETESAQEAIPASVEDYVKQVLEKESGEQTPEAQQAKPAVDPAVVEQRLGAFRSNYANRQGRLDALGQKLKDAGYTSIETDAILKEAKDILNEHHADALANGHYEATVSTWSNAATQLLSAVHAKLPDGQGKAYNDALNQIAEASQGKQASIKDAIEIAWDMAGKAAVDEYKKTRLPGLLTAATRQGRAMSESQSGSSGQRVDGTAVSGDGRLTTEDALNLPIDQLAARRRA